MAATVYWLITMWHSIQSVQQWEERTSWSAVVAQQQQLIVTERNNEGAFMRSPCQLTLLTFSENPFLPSCNENRYCNTCVESEECHIFTLIIIHRNISWSTKNIFPSASLITQYYLCYSWPVFSYLYSILRNSLFTTKK